MPSSGLWPIGREGHSATLISGDYPAIYITGGITGDKTSALSDGWLLDLKGTTWRKVS